MRKMRYLFSHLVLKEQSLLLECIPDLKDQLE